MERAWPSWRPQRDESQRWRWARGLAVLAGLLVWPLWEAFRPGRGPLAVVLALAYAASWIAAMAYGVTWTPRTRIALLVWLSALGVSVPAAHGGEPLALLGFTLSAAAWLLPTVWALMLAGAAAVIRLLTLYGAAGALSWELLPPVLTQIVTPVAVLLLIRLLVQLGQANKEIEALATAAERERLSRDLHDVLGHSLTTITAKAGLARRLLERGADPGLALAEVRDVERLSRQAHAEIRATVSGSRRPSLTAELSGVRAALRAAGIGAVLPESVDQVAEDLREPFAYVLREGVTNVIRHSGATRCEVTLTETSLEIRDNGHATAAGAAGAAATGAAGRPPGSGLAGSGLAGSGLAGLAERLRAVGGLLEAGPLPQGGFLLRASRA
ncbi:sensor histidine kinase [Nonomuraea roseoviolacea]|uniref:Two-component system sensor histidine kinase DesK n=1 Tax=Nonomuraea roseoviolacea subsp. carminata TaxID=160689 RepID=A0ABT1KBY1_9ACTN|nr:histidine kinase [Nonomuraea roseoviolacea]MCP2351511.1 two-component system sensor histidine kinase DesK [Nonomuraea roseoviolacea subsp. carminata]